MDERRSIVLVTVDCLRVDHAGFMGYTRQTTPFLDSLAAESFVFPAAIVAGAPTYYSFPAILASRFPLALGRDVIGLGPDEPTLASVLQQAGYATAALSAANPYISSRFGYERGFDTFRDFLEDETAPPIDEKSDTMGSNGWASRINRSLQRIRPALGPLGRIYDELYFRYCRRVTPAPGSMNALRRFPAADTIVDHACTWLGSVKDRPFFLWLHLMDPHAPYYPHEDALDLIGVQDVTPARARYLNSYWNRSDLGRRRLTRHRDELIALYDAGIRWVDAQLARLIETLKRSNRWDQCVFALTADHGEEFLDHGGRFHSPSRLMEELIHVPLLLRVPRCEEMELPKSPFSLLHLAPTLLDIAQLPVPAEFQGRSHWKELQRGGDFDTVAIAECVASCTNPFRAESCMGPRVLSVRDSRFKLVLHFDPGEEHLYDLAADPGELAPLPLPAEKPVRRRLLQIAHEHLRRSRSEVAAGTRLKARLRHLRLEWKNQ